MTQHEQIFSHNVSSGAEFPQTVLVIADMVLIIPVDMVLIPVFRCVGGSLLTRKTITIVLALLFLHFNVKF